MTQSYRLFTTYSKIEDKNKYFQECIENEIVNIVVTAKRNSTMDVSRKTSFRTPIIRY